MNHKIDELIGTLRAIEEEMEAEFQKARERLRAMYEPEEHPLVRK